MIKTVLSGIFFRSVLLYAFSSALTSALPVILMPLLTRHLSTSDYGILGLLTMTITIFTAVTGLSVHGAVTRQFFENSKSHFSIYVGNCILILFGSTFFAAIVISLTYSIILEFVPVSLVWLFCALITASMQFLTLLRLIVWQVNYNAKRYFWLRVAQALFIVLVTVQLVVREDFGWRGSIIAQLIGTTVVGIFSLFSLLREGFVQFSFNWTYIKDALKFSLPLIPMEIGGVALATLDSFMISKLLSPADAGVYIAGAQIGTGLVLLTSAVNKAWVPWFFKSLKEDSDVTRLKIVKMTYLYAAFLVVVAAVFSFGAPGLVVFVLGPKYQAVKDLIPWITFGAVFQGMYFMACNYFYYVQRTHILSLLWVITGIFNVIILYFFILHLKLPGAAMGTMISYLFCFILTFIAAQKIQKMPWGLKIDQRPQ